jgi:hypothetical protein
MVSKGVTRSGGMAPGSLAGILGIHLGNTLLVVESPIACSLEPRAARSQLNEWRDVLDGTVECAERASANRLVLSLLPGVQVGPIITLAQRESACCPFFDFSLEIRAERLLLAIEVPDDAVAILDQFAESVKWPASVFERPTYLPTSTVPPS